ncbi:MAG: polyprenyl synthetase family protein, partial [Comamonadaceae bacterium]
RDLRENAQARSSAEVAEVNDQKTSLLFAAAMEIAAYAAGAPRAVPTLRRAAFAIGQAFQLRDDLEDMAVDDGPVTEDPLQDTGKATLLAIAGPAAVRQAIDAQLADAVALLHAALGDDALWPQLLRMAFPEAARHLPASRQASGLQRPAAPQRRGMSQGLAA